MMRRYGFRHFSALTSFLQGKLILTDKCDREVAKATTGDTPIKLFTRASQIDPDNPYPYAYLLFAMEDEGGYTVKELADVSAKWYEAAVAYKSQGQDALAMAYLMRYKKIEEKETENEPIPERTA